MDYQVYIIENPSGKIYIGISEDVTIRVVQHNDGMSKWTASYRPWKLKWRSVRMSLGDARKLENKMKRQKGGSGLKTLMHVYSAEQPGSSSGS
ncbi:GIY-YIG nuclease family protein [Verrucomicrobiaceae bacterium 5K15]|uniref:GIY-YIG nuclease family protein n=1 Tax=Oceaniferula flava TaxID=2800421 RepID=A0AAE2VAD7_9BACT|nr:GIY-YIG nuclease family protein [Oceaniferula flavus]MBM1137926.1 GIY-YIG nuclease family protein [Oceaniferula flavus]